MMKPHKHKHRDCIIAWANGATIESKYSKDTYWNIDSNPTWKENVEYRVKEEPELIPFDFSDAEYLIGKVIKYSSRTGGEVSLITFVDKDGVGNIDFKYMLERYTFLDGSPCGKIKKAG